jgi:gamma-glutamylaminecyclotransferase
VGTQSIFAAGTLKRGFALHEEGLTNATFGGRYRTIEAFPMVIAGPWYAPMILNQPGTGERIVGELYEVPMEILSGLDALESVGQPGNFRITVQVEPVDAGSRASAFMYVKAPVLASPVHSGFLYDYQDRRFIPPSRRNGNKV